MSTATVSVKRHALGLPGGSVRAAHILSIVGLICALLLVPMERRIHVPPYLIYLLFLGLGHYFAAHGTNIAPSHTPGPSPLYLPAGTVRFLIVVLLGGTIGWLVYSNPDALMQSFRESLDEMKEQPYVLVAILGAFFLGVIVRRLVGRDNPPQAWQDFEAWLSIISLVGLLASAILHLVIGVSVTERFSLPVSEGVLGAGIAFYFGARS
jgi:hypothetical protein